MKYFVGRKSEMCDLQRISRKTTASLVVIKGRRRIGKSRLAEEFGSNYRFIRFSGIPPVDAISEQSQREVFAKQLSIHFSLPDLAAKDWDDLFTLLSQNVQTGRVVILFDEISWMGSKDPTFLGKLKNAWDTKFQSNPELMIILCGSVSTWIQENIISSTAFFGRISLCITLGELSINECNTFLEHKGYRRSSYEKFKLLSVLGGVPWYLEQIDPKLSADENIKNLCFRQSGMLFDEFNLIFHDLFRSGTEVYKKIITTLVEGPAELGTISEAVSYAKSGVLSQYLENLIEAAFITRDFTWHIKDGQISRLSQFRLSDNYLRFYLKYIARHKNKIISDNSYDVSIASLPEWTNIMGLQFENLVLKNRHIIKKILQLRSEDIVADNPFFQRKNTKQQGCQIDYLIQTRFNTLFACEIKFSKHEIKSDILEEMKNKLARLSTPKGFARLPVLIHVNGLNEHVLDKQYFTEVIDFGVLLEEDQA
jgi:AAA+ ATPase superfamily predicted ATPase